MYRVFGVQVLKANSGPKDVALYFIYFFLKPFLCSHLIQLIKTQNILLLLPSDTTIYCFFLMLFMEFGQNPDASVLIIKQRRGPAEQKDNMKQPIVFSLEYKK